MFNVAIQQNNLLGADALHEESFRYIVAHANHLLLLAGIEDERRFFRGGV